MRLWTLHPKYLDARGLVALWREGLLQGWGTPDAVLASAGKKWAVGVMGTVMYAIAGLIFGLIARFSLKVLRWDWR